MSKNKVSIFWFRRDLRLEDNHGLSEALKGDYPVLPVFIFDTDIIDELKSDDQRISFIYKNLQKINENLNKHSASLLIRKSKPTDVFKELFNEYDIHEVYTNEDYEPYSIERDSSINKLLSERNVKFSLYKDQVIFEKGEILKADSTPYTIYTPYKNKWLEKFKLTELRSYNSQSNYNYLNKINNLPTLQELGFTKSSINIPKYNFNNINDYEKYRDIPSLDKTSHLSTHLRFGTISIREAINKAVSNDTFLSELIWREFFMQILFHFPRVIDSNFKKKYDNIKWRNNPEEFEKWKNGNTGYPMVDAGMRQLNATGFMHNRVRMITAGFLCKHLLIDWRWGEAYFAEKLIDYELSSNNGNWQWAAGTGCDAAPYFRVFNPLDQQKKFDSDLVYIMKWIPEYGTENYIKPIVDHKFARERALKAYKEGIIK